MYDKFTLAFEREIKNGTEDSTSWFRDNNQIPLNDTIIHSLATEGYRNKVEFTIGLKYNLEQ